MLEIFEDPIFFKKLKFINDNTYEVLRRINEKYHIIIVSIGTPINLSRKAEWLHNNLPFINDYVLLNNGNCEMNKGIVNMSQYPGSILIDDVTSNLDSSDAWNKIVFGKEYSWSKTKGYKRCFDWAEVERELL